MKQAVLATVCVLAVGCSGSRSVAPAASGAGSTFTIADLIDVKHPSSPVWSPDGSRVVFVWDRAGVSNLYVSDLSSAPRPLTTETGAGVTSTPFWSNDGARVFFAHRGDLWQVPAAGGAPVTVWITPAVESDITCAPDGMRVAFARRSDTGTELVVRTLDGGAETVVARDAQAIGGLSWSPDGRRIAFSAGARSIRHEQIPDYSGAKIV